MCTKNLNLCNACCYVQHLRIDQLDGLDTLLEEKMKELGVSSNRRHAKAFDTSGKQAPTGNMRSILDWASSLDEHCAEKNADGSTKPCISNLQTLHAVVHRRLGSAGYKAKA